MALCELTELCARSGSVLEAGERPGSMTLEVSDCRRGRERGDRYGCESECACGQSRCRLQDSPCGAVPVLPGAAFGLIRVALSVSVSRSVSKATFLAASARLLGNRYAAELLSEVEVRE